MAKQNREDPLGELEKAYAQWQALYNHGGSEPTWPDGVNLNLVRNHIYYYKRQIEEKCPLYMGHELYQRPLPPEVDDNYMARAGEIREHAKQSLQAYLADPATAICFGTRTTFLQKPGRKCAWTLCCAALHDRPAPRHRAGRSGIYAPS